MFGRNIRKALVLLKNTLEQESESTKEMLKSYQFAENIIINNTSLKFSILIPKLIQMITIFY